MPAQRWVMIGDSTVAGQEDAATGFRSPRGPLQSLITGGGFEVDWVGPNSSTPASGGTDPQHAGWGGASIDSTGVPTNNITDRLTAIFTNVGTVDGVVLMLGWNDVYGGTSNAATKYETLAVNIRDTRAPTAKLVLVTMWPQPGQTETQTNSDLPIYAGINAKIRALSGSGSGRVSVADLAALTGSNARSEFIEAIIRQAKMDSQYTTNAGGGAVFARWPGTMFTSALSITDSLAAATTSPPYAGTTGSGDSENRAPSSAGLGRDTFPGTFSCILNWAGLYAAPGDDSTNTGSVIANQFAMTVNAAGSWTELFAGARASGIAWQNGSNLGGVPQAAIDAGFLQQQRADGVSTMIRVQGQYGGEFWPADTEPSRGITGPYPGVDRTAMAAARGFLYGFQVRPTLVNPAGTNDIARSRKMAKAGGDIYAALTNGNLVDYLGHYDYLGYPRRKCDLGGSAWVEIAPTETWQTIACFTFAYDPAVPIPRIDAGGPPPWTNYGPWAYNNYPTYGWSEAEFRANPPPLPSSWNTSGTGGTGTGYQLTDYWINSTTGNRDIHAIAGGAAKQAQIIYDAMRPSLAGSSSGGGAPVTTVPPLVLTGLPTRPRYATRGTGSQLGVGGVTGLATAPRYGAATSASTSAPSWASSSLPVAVVGAAYTGNVRAVGTPDPTYTILSGAPAWLSCSSAGVLSGTPTGAASTFSVTFRATNSAGTADVTLILQVGVGVVVTTTSLPGAIQNQPYYQQLAAVGVAPFTWAITAGTLPAGVSRTGDVILGTPTTLGSSAITVQVTDATGATNSRALTLVVAAASALPVITTASLPAATVGDTASNTIAATGTAPITFAVVSGALPPGRTLNTGTGAITGTFSAAGAFGFTVRATNSFGFGEMTYSQTVNADAVVRVSSPWGRFVRQ